MLHLWTTVAVLLAAGVATLATGRGLAGLLVERGTWA